MEHQAAQLPFVPTESVTSAGRQEQGRSARCVSLLLDSSTMLGDPISFATDAITREWFVNVEHAKTKQIRTYHVTVADYTSVNPDSPRIVLGVNGVRWSVEVHYGFSAYPLCGPPCTYSWQLDGNTFELALDAISLHTWRGGLLLFVNGRESKTRRSKPFFWFRRFVLRALIGLLWLAAGLSIHYFASKATHGEENLHRLLVILMFLGLSIITMVMVLPCAIGLSYFFVGCLGVCKFGIANVLMDANENGNRLPPNGRRGLKFNPRATTKTKSGLYTVLEEESPYATVPLSV